MAKARARANGEGSIYQRKDTGKWVAQIVVGMNEAGRPQYLRFQAETRKEAAAWLTSRQADRQKGLIITPTKESLGEFMTEWLRDVVEPNRKPTTARTYRWIVESHLRPTLGGLPIAKIQPAQVQALYADRQKVGLDSLTVRSIHRVLHRILETAKRQGKVLVNVTELVEPPKIQSKEMEILTPEQARTFLQVAKFDRLHALYVVAIQLGLRQAELLGLRWSDVDFEEHTLTVAQTVNHVGGKVVFGTPKSKSSNRRLDMPPPVEAALKRHKAKQDQEKEALGDAEAWEHPELIFVTRRGTPLSPQNVYKRSFVPLLEAAGCPRIRFHDLRHTAISMMGFMGLTLKEAQEIAGHSTPALTASVYTHTFREQKRQAAKRIGDFWAGRDAKVR